MKTGEPPSVHRRVLMVPMERPISGRWAEDRESSPPETLLPVGRVALRSWIRAPESVMPALPGSGQQQPLSASINWWTAGRLSPAEQRTAEGGSPHRLSLFGLRQRMDQNEIQRWPLMVIQWEAMVISSDWKEKPDLCAPVLNVTVPEPPRVPPQVRYPQRRESASKAQPARRSRMM